MVWVEDVAQTPSLGTSICLRGGPKKTKKKERKKKKKRVVKCMILIECICVFYTVQSTLYIYYSRETELFHKLVVNYLFNWKRWPANDATL